MHLRDQCVRVVARIADHRNAFGVSLHVGAAGTEHELRRVVALVKEGMAGWSVAVEAFKVELRAARVQQRRGIGVRPSVPNDPP